MLRTRFAPSPTGPLHLGHAYSALMARDRADAEGGEAVLRIDDLDQSRSREEWTELIFLDLAWLGLGFEDKPWSSAKRYPHHKAALDTLIDEGLAYRCFRTRREVAKAAQQAPHGEDCVYRSEPLSEAEEAERLERGEAFAWRLSMAAVTRRFGPHADRLVFHDSAEGRVRIRLDALSDAILGRKDGSASYHLACVVDDHAQGVTKVTRGRDLLSSTPVQRLLYELLALPPPVYAHHSLVCDGAGRRLAKRDGARSLMELRGRGVDPEQLCADLRRGRLAAYDAQLTG